MSHPLSRIIPYAVLAASVGLSGITALAPAPNRLVAAVFPPWWTAERAFSAAATSGASIVRFGGFASIVVLSPEAIGASQKLRDAGALVLLNAFAGGCIAGGSSRSPSTAVESGVS